MFDLGFDPKPVQEKYLELLRAELVLWCVLMLIALTAIASTVNDLEQFGVPYWVPFVLWSAFLLILGLYLKVNTVTRKLYKQIDLLYYRCENPWLYLTDQSIKNLLSNKFAAQYWLDRLQCKGIDTTRLSELVHVGDLDCVSKQLAVLRAEYEKAY